MPRHQFLWVDLETTGLDPQRCQILEWAAVLAADDAGGDMSIVDAYSSPIAVRNPPEMDAFVREMHTKNGLLEECRACSVTLADSEDALVKLAEDLTGSKAPRGIVLAGGSVHFDLAFFRVHMPRFAACLSCSVFDVSTLKQAEWAWNSGESFPEVKSGVHRALPDLEASLAEATRYRERRYGSLGVRS